MPSACVLIFNSKGQLLLQKRRDNHFWGYPGGALDIGESFEECAVREAYEETGLTCLNLQYFAHSSGSEMHYIYPNGDEVYIVELIFICKEYTGNMCSQKFEVEEQCFFDLDKLPSNISPIQIKTINQLLERVKIKSDKKSAI